MILKSLYRNNTSMVDLQSRLCEYQLKSLQGIPVFPDFWAWGIHRIATMCGRMPDMFYYLLK